MNKPEIRLIEAKDNSDVKDLVIETLAEFGLKGEGFAGVDEELADMFEAYSDALSAYYVVELGGEIKGVGGYAPLVGTEPGTIVELRKMYLRPELRGQGIGDKLIDLCIEGAQLKGYELMYLETVPAMKAAHHLYQKKGFSYIEQRMGDTGHDNCGVYMTRTLND